MELDERKRMILSAIVSAYIETGEPVGSKTLIDREKLSVSSATVRNEMSELERLGYLQKTHTSSGRVPSNLGYRYYISTLRPYALSETEQEELNGAFTAGIGLEDLLDLSAQHLAAFSGCTVFAASPHSPDGIYHFELFPAGRKTLVVMVISSGGAVKSYFFRSPQEITSADTELLSSIIDRLLSGIPADQIGPVRTLLLEHEIKERCPKHAQIIPTLKKILSEIREYELHIGGTENLLNYPEFADVNTARDLLGMFSRQENILDALLSAASSDPLEVRIGIDNGLFQSPHASLITLFSNEKFPVLLGLMGPARMNYARTIAGCNHFLAHLKTFVDREYN